MAGGKRDERSRKNRPNNNLSQYGLFDIPNDMNMAGDEDDENDSDLEAELLKLTGEGPKPKPRQKPKVPQADLDAMVAESMKDIPSDEDLSGDEDDPALLQELNFIIDDGSEEPEETPATPGSSTPSDNDTTKMLEERLAMYEKAEQNAKAVGESGRARRFNRGIKTIKDLIKKSKAGISINNDDIPPEVSTGEKKPPKEETDNQSVENEQEEPQENEVPDSVSSPEELKPHKDQKLIDMLNERKNQYKIAALKAKKLGDHDTALNYIKIAKQFDHVISAAENGQPVDVSRMPEPPQEVTPKIEQNQTQTSSEVIAEPVAEPGDDAPEVLIMASSVAEALEQRLEIYKKQEESAKEQQNSSKARRMGRIVKQYEQAIKLYKAGKPLPIDELPTPPGYGPIPVEGAASAPPKSTPTSPPSKPSNISPKTDPSTSKTVRITGNQVPNSRAEKQLQLLLAKQKEFKLAALNAKKKGEIEQAKEFLRTAKGFEPLIQSATCGLPIDLSTLPLSPKAKSQINDEYEVIFADEATTEENDDDDRDIISRLELQLTKQLKMCLTNRDHNKALGDVAGTNRFERLALNVTKDLDLVRLARRSSSSPKIPKFHYEPRDFSIVKSFTDINENELEITVLCGISYHCTNPNDIDTYVKFDFPFPQEQPYSGRTNTIKNTNSPEYNQSFIVPIQRTSRACQRVFKRHSIKFEVYSKGCWCASDYALCFSGFFRGDTLIGTATVKLQNLENRCELHESFDLYEGRKKIGGKLEIRMRLRHPIVSQEVEQIHEKWLVIDN